MSGKKTDPDRDPLLRLQLNVPRWLCWMLAGALVGNVNDLGPLVHEIARLLL